MNWLLVVVLVLFLCSVYSGYKKGFVKTLISIIAMVIAIIMTTVLTPYIAKEVEKKEIVTKKIKKNVVMLITITGKNESDEEQEEFIDNMPVPKYIKTYLKKHNNLHVYKERELNSFNEYIVDGMVRVIVNLITYVVLYFVIRICISLVAIAGNLISRLPVFQRFEGKGGTFLGGIKGVMEIWIVFIIVIFMSHTQMGQSALECIDENPILGVLYNNNIILNNMHQFLK